MDGKECYGSIDYNSQVIKLRQDNSEKQNEATLLHEVIHGIADMYNLDFDEDTVTTLADALYTVATDNDIDIFN